MNKPGMRVWLRLPSVQQSLDANTPVFHRQCVQRLTTVLALTTSARQSATSGPVHSPYLSSAKWRALPGRSKIQFQSRCCKVRRRTPTRIKTISPGEPGNGPNMQPHECEGILAIDRDVRSRCTGAHLSRWSGSFTESPQHGHWYRTIRARFSGDTGVTCPKSGYSEEGLDRRLKWSRSEAVCRRFIRGPREVNQ